MAEPKIRGWTEIEKLSLFIEIASYVGKIPWNDLKLPEGRTIKACQVMFDKERSKVKKALAGQTDGNTEDGGNEGKKPAAKRGKPIDSDAEAKQKPVKKSKASKKPKAEPVSEEEGEENDGMLF